MIMPFAPGGCPVSQRLPLSLLALNGDLPLTGSVPVLPGACPGAVQPAPSLDQIGECVWRHRARACIQNVTPANPVGAEVSYIGAETTYRGPITRRKNKAWSASVPPKAASRLYTSAKGYGTRQQTPGVDYV